MEPTKKVLGSMLPADDTHITPRDISNRLELPSALKAFRSLVARTALIMTKMDDPRHHGACPKACGTCVVSRMLAVDWSRVDAVD